MGRSSNSYGYKVLVTERRVGEHEQMRIAVASNDDLVLCEVVLMDPSSENVKAATNFALAMMRVYLIPE